MRPLVALIVSLLAAPALGDEETFIFKSEEDPTTPPDPAVCAQAPFVTNVPLGASLWSLKTKKKSGRVVDRARRIGRATGCLQLTNAMFPEGLVQNFFARFDLPEGTYDAVGTCTVASNATPQPFIILAGCTLKLVRGPAGSLGGSAVSSSIFNPLHRPGFSTGSVWTLHEYVQAGARNPHAGHHQDDDED